MQKNPFLHLIANNPSPYTRYPAQRTDVGKQLIQFADNNSGRVLEVLEQRQRVKEKINNLFRKRTQTALRRRKSDDISGEEKTTLKGCRMWNEILGKAS
jgi:hypothetical protein